MYEILLEEKMNSKGREVGKIRLIRLGENYRIEFDGKKNYELSEQFYLQIKYDYINYIKCIKLTFPGCTVSSSDRYVCLDAKAKEGITVFNELKKKLLNYFDII